MFFFFKELFLIPTLYNTSPFYTDPNNVGETKIWFHLRVVVNSFGPFFAGPNNARGKKLALLFRASVERADKVLNLSASFVPEWLLYSRFYRRIPLTRTLRGGIGPVLPNVRVIQSLTLSVFAKGNEKNVVQLSQYSFTPSCLGYE